MPYEPFTTSRRDRERNFYLVWCGAAGSLIMLAVYLWRPDSKMLPFGPLLGFSAGSIIATGFRKTMDDYYLALSDSGLRLMGGYVAIYFVVLWLIRPFAHQGGTVFALHDRMADAYLLGISAIVVFHLGYGWAWWRGRI